MEFDDIARSDRSALLQQGAFYRANHHPQEDQIAYDNPTARQDQIEREETTPHRTAPRSATNDTPLSPPPPYEHALNQNRLYARDEPSTSSLSVCPHHSPRIDSDECTQTTQLSESDSDVSQYLGQCSCQLVMGDGDDHDDNGAGVECSAQQRSTPQHYAIIGADSITIDATDTNPQARMFTAWQRSTGQTGSEIEISNKSSKQLFKLMAGMDGHCKMSSECRCDECQSHYFDCDFDNNENHKTDGGLGAGTPMFINEVMHGAACNIL